MNDIIGFIKFIDSENIDKYFDLEKLWLSNVDKFYPKKEEDNSGLTNDNYEGKVYNLLLDHPKFITSFTTITKDLFSNKGILKKDIYEKLIEEEENGKQRDFIVIPCQNMINLLDQLKPLFEDPGIFESFDEGINKIKAFSRFVEYKDDYKSEMKKLENNFIKNKNWSREELEKMGDAFLATKSKNYSVQNEFRIGAVLEQPKDEYEKNFSDEEKKGIEFFIDAPAPITFAKEKHSYEYLRKLKEQDFDINK